MSPVHGAWYSGEQWYAELNRPRPQRLVVITKPYAQTRPDPLHTVLYTKLELYRESNRDHPCAKAAVSCSCAMIFYSFICFKVYPSCTIRCTDPAHGALY